MGPFALSVPAYRLGQQQHRKRKKPEENEHADSPSPDAEGSRSSSHLPSDSINPRSHSPNTLRQFALAGLSPEEDLPSNIHPNFPHKPLPKDYPAAKGQAGKSKMSAATSGSEADVDTDASEGRRTRDVPKGKSYSARMKHLNTLTAILHRCLHEGDIPRAKRAFSLLIRTRDIDIRLNNLWTVGAEILMRDGEKRPSSKADEDQTMSDRQDAPATDEHNAQDEPPPRWGSAANVDKVKDYLENLIRQHPYDAYRQHLTSAVDFWPALFSTEMYNLDAECKRALHQLERDEEPELSVYSGAEAEDGSYETQHRSQDREALRRAARDEIRHETQAAAQQIAARMDQLMESAPYATHAELLRLRGLAALFVGDLCLSSRMLRLIGEARPAGVPALSEYLRGAAENVEEREALANREQEMEKARGFFQRVLDNRGVLEPWLRDLLELDDDE